MMRGEMGKAIAGLVLVVAGSALLPVAEPAAAKEPVPLADDFYLGGRAKLAVKRVYRERPMLTWRLSIDGESFALHGLGASPLTGTFERKGGKGKKLLLAFDESSLDDFAELLEDLADSLLVPSNPSLTVTSVRALVVVGKTPDKSKLKLRVNLEANVDGSPTKGFLKLNGKGVSRRVIVLDDDRSAPQVLEALRRRKIAAFNVGYYEEWDGIHPSLSDTDVVLFLQGYEYDDALAPEADQALVDFVDAGGLLVRTEWCAYEWGDGNGNLAIDAYLPVIAPESDYLEGEVCTWTLQDRAHPLTRGLDETFDIEGAGFSFVEPVDGCEVLATNQRDEPVLALIGIGPGEVVHINHDLTYEVEVIAPEILRVLVNCARYGLRR